MTIEEIREMVDESKRYNNKLDIVVLDYASLYSETYIMNRENAMIKSIVPKIKRELRNMARKKCIEAIYETI